MITPLPALVLRPDEALITTTASCTIRATDEMEYASSPAEP